MSNSNTCGINNRGISPATIFIDCILTLCLAALIICILFGGLEPSLNPGPIQSFVGGVIVFRCIVILWLELLIGMADSDTFLCVCVERAQNKSARRYRAFSSIIFMATAVMALLYAVHWAPALAAFAVLMIEFLLVRKSTSIGQEMLARRAGGAGK